MPDTILLCCKKEQNSVFCNKMDKTKTTILSKNKPAPKRQIFMFSLICSNRVKK